MVQESSLRILSGVDIVDIARFTKIIERRGEAFVAKVFLETEVTNASIEHLAAIFAAKEAIMKALSLKNSDWLSIEIQTLPSGKPQVKLSVPIKQQLISSSLSLTHDKDTAVAFFVALVV